MILNKNVLAIGVLALGTTSLVSAEALTRQLQIGMSGLDVGTLQTFLAKDITVYPQGKVTNYFGFLTKSAVSNFQSKNGIASIGRVGPQTLAAINAQMAGGSVNTGNNGAAPYISNMSLSVNSNFATIAWMTNENAKATVYYSTSPLQTYERDNSVDVTGQTQTNNNFMTSQSIVLNSLQNNTTYYYMIVSTDVDGNVSVSVPSTFRVN